MSGVNGWIDACDAMLFNFLRFFIFLFFFIFQKNIKKTNWENKMKNHWIFIIDCQMLVGRCMDPNCGQHFSVPLRSSYIISWVACCLLIIYAKCFAFTFELRTKVNFTCLIISPLPFANVVAFGWPLNSLMPCCVPSSSFIRITTLVYCIFIWWWRRNVRPSGQFSIDDSVGIQAELRRMKNAPIIFFFIIFHIYYGWITIACIPSS